MSEHIHAESMLLYAHDAAETETPWKLWEYSLGDEWLRCTHHPMWEPNCEYRRMPRTVRRGNVELPAPYHDAPAVNTPYYTLTFGCVRSYPWTFSAWDYMHLEHGVCFRTQEDAMAWAAFIRCGAVPKVAADA